MAFSKSLFQYWNGSAWVTAQTPANNSALISLSLADKQGQPMRMEVRLANKMNNPFSGTLSDAKGNLSGVLSDFQRVRVIDEATRFVLFYGRIYKTDENHDMAYGNVITIQAFDALEELKDNVTDGHTDITINGAGSDTYPTSASPTTSADRRSGLIKGFISLFSKSGNITFSDTDRFSTSAVEFAGSSTEYPLEDSGNKSALSHIAVISKDDPHTTARKTLTYDYYVDPNFQSTGAVQPAAQFNYFSRGSRPTTPATYGLRVEYPTGGGLTKTGRIQPMMSDYDFERPRAELFTEAACHYIDEGPDTFDGSANKDKGFDSEEKTVKFELIKIRNISGAFTWQGKAIGGGVVGTDSAEYLTGNNAKIQYVSATSGGTTNDPEYALISDVTNSFPNSGTITGQTSGSTFIIVSRPKETYGIVKTARLGTTNINNADVIREQAVSRLRRSTDEIIRGRFRIVSKPWFHVETNSTTISGTTITFGGGFNPQSYGFKVGMSVTKVTATGTVQSYGYATAVTSSTVVVGGGMSASVSNGDIVRLYIPVRASNNAYVVNRLVNISGSDFLITAMEYTEDNGILNTQLEVVGADSGLGPVQNVVGAVIQAVTDKERYETGTGNRRIDRGLKLSSKFTHDGTNPHTTIDWSAGQLTVGGTSFKITAGTNVFGATGEYYLYHTGVEGSTGFSASLVSSYTINKKNVLVAWVRVNSTSDSSSRLEFKTIGQIHPSVPGIGNASSVLNTGSVTTTQLDATFVADTAGKTKIWYQANPPDGDGSDDVSEGDNWIRTSDLRVYRADSDNADAIAAGPDSNEWELVNEGDAVAVLANATATTANTLAGTKNTLHRQNQVWKDSNNGVQVGDILVAVDNETIWTWTGSAWVLRSDAGAINHAGTDINGGLINTQTIILTSGGSNNILQTGAGTGSGTRVLLSHSGIYGYNGGTSQFSLHTSDGKAYFGGGVVKLAADGMTVGDTDVTNISGAGSVIFKFAGTNANSYNMFNYEGVLYIRSAGGYNVLSATNNNQMSLGSSIFGFKELYFGTTGTSTATKLWSDSGTLKWGNTAVGSAGTAIINSGKNDYLAVYKDDSSGSSTHSTTIGDSDSGTLYFGNSLIPDADGSYSIGLGTQSQDGDVAVLRFVAYESSIAGNPPFCFANVNNTGMSYRTSGGYSFVNFETNDTDIFRVGLHKIEVRAGGIVPSGNNLRHVGSYTSNVWSTPNNTSDLRFGSGNFKDFSTTRKAHFHYSYLAQSPEPSGGFAIDEDSSRVHITCPLYYDNVHMPLSGGGESTADMEIIYYANNNQHKMVRAASSARFKDNIRDLDIDTSKVWDLQPRSFEWKGDGTTSFGLIAEEVDEILPGLVAKYAHGDSDEAVPQSVHYKFLSVLLLAEMKELKARIEELEKE